MRLHQHVRHAYPAAEGWLLTRTTDRLKGVDFARRALEAAGDDPGVLANDTWQRRDFGSGKLALDSWHRPIFDISCGGAVLRASVIDLCSFNELLAKKRSY